MLEPTTPEPRPRRGRAAVVGISLLGAVTAGVAVLTAGGSGSPRLALVSGASGAGAESLRSSAPAGEPASASFDASVDSKLALYPGYLAPRYKVEGDLPELGGEGRAWRFTAHDFDSDRAKQVAAALGLKGSPVARDGGFALESPEGSFYAFPSADSWSINFNRTPAGEAGADDQISAADAEQAARALLDAMGVRDGTWDVDVTETEVGVAYGCAAPGMTPEEAERMKIAESEKLAASGGGSSGSSGTAVAMPAPDAPVTSDTPVVSDVAPMPPIADCPPPPPPVKAQHVAFFPVVDDLRADWSMWNVTVQADGTIANVYGTWTDLEAAGSYPLRGVADALEELRNPEQFYGDAARTMPAIATDAGPAVPPAAAVAPAPGAASIEPALVPERDADLSADDTVASDPAIMPMPEPVQQVITITGVTRSLTATSVWVDGTVRTYLVPAYRFTGSWETEEMGDRWETTMIALHADAIAPPPAPEAKPEPLTSDVETKVRTDG